MSDYYEAARGDRIIASCIEAIVGDFLTGDIESIALAAVRKDGGPSVRLYIDRHARPALLNALALLQAEVNENIIMHSKITAPDCNRSYKTH